MDEGPDQGFAWIIALACFFINFIMVGLARTVSILYVAIINLYGVTREEAMLPFSIRVSVRNMTGPLIGFLGQKYGIRAVTAVGGLVAGLGIIFCYFAPNIFWITISWGIIHGLGFGLTTVLHMMVVSQYFDKYKASALGFAYTGDCFGTFVFPVIIEYLFSEYDIRGSFLIIGGIVLNTIPMALLLREPPWIKDKNMLKNLKMTKSKILSNQTNTCDKTNGVVKEMSKISRLSCEDLESLHCKLLRMKILADNPVYEHVLNEKIVYSRIRQLSGQYNPSFQSSNTDISSLNEQTEIKCSSNIINSNNLLTNQQSKDLFSTTPQIYNVGAKSKKSFPSADIHSSISSIKCSKTFKQTDDFPGLIEIRTGRSVSDSNTKNDSLSTSCRSAWFNKLHNAEDRRCSLPPVLGKGTNLKEKLRISNSSGSTSKELDNVDEMSAPRCKGTGVMMRRKSSFVGQVAQEIVNRLRTASIASQVAQDAFVTSFPQEDEPNLEPEIEYQLKSITEHKIHDSENSSHEDAVFFLNTDSKEDLNPAKYMQRNKIQEMSKPPSMMQLMIRTNTKPMFILISISMAAYVYVFIGIMTIIIDYASDLGISKDDGKYLIIGFSVADLFGRLSFGQVIDRKLIKMKNYSGCTMLLMGAVVAAIPANRSFNYVMACMCMYGLVQGGTAIMFPILINKYMDKNAESVAMGCLNFYAGLLMLSMAPMIGFFRDNIGSYSGVFYIIGGIVAAVGIAWQLEPMIVKYQNKKLREKQSMKDINMTDKIQ